MKLANHFKNIGKQSQGLTKKGKQSQGCDAEACSCLEGVGVQLHFCFVKRWVKPTNCLENYLFLSNPVITVIA